MPGFSGVIVLTLKESVSRPTSRAILGIKCGNACCIHQLFLDYTTNHPKSQWFTTTKICFSLLLHVLCGLAACLYSESQTARSTLIGPGMAGPEERKASPAMALRPSGQGTVTSDPVPLANKPSVIIRMGSVFISQRRTQALRNKNRICHNYEVCRTLPDKQKSLNKYENQTYQSVKWVNNSTSLTGSLGRGNSTTGPG